MRWLDAPGQDLTVKCLTVKEGKRTSLQRHDRKDELLVIIGGTGYVERRRGTGRKRVRADQAGCAAPGDRAAGLPGSVLL